MTKRFTIIPAGTFKGKRITVADTDRVDEYPFIANEFMSEIFGLFPGDYAISDESELRDFVAFCDRDTSSLWSLIEEHYNVSRTDVGTEKLVDIFSTIAQRITMQ